MDGKTIIITLAEYEMLQRIRFAVERLVSLPKEIDSLRKLEEKEYDSI